MTPMWRLSDERLAKLARTGDERALTLLFERHGPGLYRYCRSIVHHDQDAQDVVQTTMLRAIAALRRSELEGALRPWLFRIAHNESITLLRRRRPTDDIEEQSGVTGVPIEARLEDRERLTTLVADLRELPERQRAALIMRELNGLSHAEISAALDIPISATKQAIFEARRGLQAAQAGRDMACEPVQRAISDGDGRVLRARIHEQVCEQGFDPQRNCFRSAYGKTTLDASLLLLAQVGFVAPTDPRYVGTVEAIERELSDGPYVYRYKAADDFGEPAHAFLVCSFWLIDALVAACREHRVETRPERVGHPPVGARQPQAQPRRLRLHRRTK